MCSHHDTIMPWSHSPKRELNDLGPQLVSGARTPLSGVDLPWATTHTIFPYR